jgi:hypothetical protein
MRDISILAAFAVFAVGAMINSVVCGIPDEEGFAVESIAAPAVVPVAQEAMPDPS